MSEEKENARGEGQYDLKDSKEPVSKSGSNTGADDLSAFRWIEGMEAGDGTEDKQAGGLLADSKQRSVIESEFDSKMEFNQVDPTFVDTLGGMDARPPSKADPYTVSVASDFGDAKAVGSKDMIPEAGSRTHSARSRQEADHHGGEELVPEEHVEDGDDGQLEEDTAGGEDKETDSGASSAGPKRAMTPGDKRAAEKKMVTIRIRPQDGDWVMGDDHEMTLPFDISIMSIKKLIEEERGIHHERSNMMHPRGKKNIEKIRESWSLRRHGIGNRDVIVMSPTAPGGWTWHSLEYYHRKLVSDVISEILLAGNYVRLADIERKLSKPPPIRESALVLIKQYPDKIHVRTELSTGHTLLGISMIGQSSAFYESKLVPIPKEIMQLPTFEAGSVLSGTMNPPVDTYDFDWDAYSDLDSVGFDAGAIVMPDTIYNIAIFHAYACWPDGDSFNPPNPFADVFWNGRRTGLTPLRCFDFTPGWVTCKIQMRQGPKEDITNCHLRINLFSFRSSSTCVLLGTISFDGPQLKDLLSPQISARIEQFQLQTFKPSSRAMRTITSASRNPEAEKKEEIVDKARGDATDTPVEEADVAYNADLDAEAAAKADKDFPHLALEEQDGQFETGNATIKIAILHCEFEVRVQFCQALVNSEGSDVSPFVIVIFNGRDIGMTDVKAGETWPVWVNPSAYSMKIGTLDIFECSLNVEVWQMGTTGRENLLGQVVFSGKQFVDLVGEASTRFIRHIKELSMPIVRGKDKDAKAASAGKAPKKAKAIASYGKVCFDIGPVGLPSAVDQEFELSIISGVNLSGENVYCQVHWNYVSLGNTTSATYVDPIADKATGETATAEGNPSADVAHIPPWTWGTNKFLFSCSSEEDALKNSSLKIYLVDAGEKTKLKPGDKPVVVKLGCISLTGDALVDFLTTENSLAATTKLDFARDPDESRPQRPPRGYLTVRRGPRGARMEGERTLVVHAARLTLIDLNVASAVAPRPRVARTSLNVDDGSVAAASAAPHEFGYYINAYFNDQSIGSSAHCIADEDVDPFWSDAWFQLPVNGQALKECSVRLELMMYRVISAPHENELSALGETSTGGGGGSSSLKKGISSSKLSSTNDMLKPGEGLPFVVATLTLSGNELKAVVGSKLTTRSEKELEPIAVTKASKSKKVDKFNLKPEALQTHSLKSGLILVGSPGSAVASPLDILRAEGKILAEKFNEYATNKLPVVVGKVTEQPEKAGDFDQGAALDNVAPAKDSNENDHEVPEIGPAFEDRKMDSESEKMDNVGNGADQLTVQAQVAVEALPGTDFKNTLTDDEIPVIVEGGS